MLLPLKHVEDAVGGGERTSFAVIGALLGARKVGDFQTSSNSDDAYWQDKVSILCRQQSLKSLRRPPKVGNGRENQYAGRGLRSKYATFLPVLEFSHVLTVYPQEDVTSALFIQQAIANILPWSFILCVFKRKCILGPAGQVLPPYLIRPHSA